MASKTKRTKKAKKTPAEKKPRTKKASANGAERGPNVMAFVTKMVSRKQGATKKEIIAALLEAVPGRDETKTDNTVRGLLSVLGRKKGAEKVTKAKDEKRGNVYTQG